ncbi:DUF2666 superfamily protein [Candidatus Mancarchaeum acidiphilum]|uniref:DUF2666 superfamily protein n=1 Tax=Candidatus Mancarchaeum acidiphilum TaxID=1920749 RepID=A0A218NNJ7_9ARCH|nr:DUF2666 family protein [Candidatus Mancarchaeum acidiphilum]ASI14045.1 DUF2666 superfamily protein [Candidatus Mancarchaeum acidiphilum]
MDGKPDNYIDFSVKYNDWVAIKRLSIDDKVTPEEVVYNLASIESSIDSKVYKFLGIDINSIDSLAKNLAKQSGSGYKGLPKLASLIDTKQVKDSLSKACKTQVVVPFAKSYLLDKSLKYMKLSADIELPTMLKAFPDLKARYKYKAPKSKILK